MALSKLYSLILLLPLLVNAANDWNTPCLNGSCSYDLQNTTSPHGRTGGSIYINGSTSAISDLTQAAGWDILDCDPNGTSQTIRAVCTGESNGCSALYENGAVGTVVRLPENCSKMAFARVASEYTHENQTLPDNISQKLKRRDDAAVRGIVLDTQFNKINASHHGHVSMFLRGASGATADVAQAPPTARSLQARSWWDDVTSAVSDALDDFSNDFSKDETSAIPITYDKTFPIWNATAKCAPSQYVPAFSAGIDIAAEAKVNATLSYGVAVSGTIVPPEINDFGLVAGLDLDLDGILKLDILASATLNSGQYQIASSGLPGLDFTGILTIGPSFVLNAQANAQITADASVSVDLAYKGTGARLYFPDDNGSSTWGNIVPSDSTIQVSSNPSVTASGSITAHIVPTIAFGITALGDVATATVNLNLDAQAGVSVSLSESTTKAFNGCADVSSGFSVNAVANGDFFNIFKENYSVPLYSKTWDLWKKCFGTATSRRREHARFFPSFPKRDGVDCSTVTPGTRQNVTDTTIPASSIAANQTSSS